MQTVFESYPELLAIIVLVLGVILARLIASAVASALAYVDERLARYSVSGGVIISPVVIRYTQNFVFWFIVVAAVVAAISFLDIQALTVAIDGLLIFIGQLLVGLAIVAMGHVFGLTARVAIDRFTGSDPAYVLAARLVHATIIVVAVVMGLAQLKIDTSLITQLLLVVFAAGLGGLSLAFAIGSRDHVANLLAQRELKRYSIGERLTINDSEGTVIAIHDTGVDIETARGVVSVPASEFARSHVTRLIGGEPDG